METNLSKTSRVHYICDSTSGRYDIWLDVHLLTPSAFDNTKLRYNIVLDVYKIPRKDYFDNIIKTREKNNGFEGNVDKVTAAYNFSNAPNELDGFSKNLTTFIEDTYIYRKATLICPSTGCWNSLYLLNAETENCETVFIKRLVTLTAPRDGSFKAGSSVVRLREALLDLLEPHVSFYSSAEFLRD